YSFFLHSSRPHRNLHSFPTRRSSDLSRGAAPPAQGDRQRDSARLRDAPREAVTEPPHLAGGRGRLVAGRAGSRLSERRCPVFSRSEEHTSELQSRGHLVCRLLLEKKK